MELHSLLWLLVAIISIFPVIVFWKGYLKLGTRNLLLTATAFTLFLVKAITLAMKIIMERELINDVEGYSDELWWSVAAVIDMIIIGLIGISFTNGSGTEPEPKD